MATLAIPSATSIVSDQFRLVDRYPYRDGDGRLLYEVRRFYPKRFDLVDARAEALADFPADVLYRLPELRQADPAQTVYVVEGEKDVDNLRRFGLVATTNPGGTRRGWRPAYSEALRGRHVLILPEADGPGKCHAADVAGALAGVTRSVVTLELPGLHGRDDVSDWLARGHTVAKLEALVAKARYARAGLTAPPRGAGKAALIFGSDLDATAKFLLLALMHHARPGGAKQLDVVDLSAAALGWLTSVHRVTAQRTISHLRRDGILRRSGAGHTLAWDILAVIAAPHSIGTEGVS